MENNELEEMRAQLATLNEKLENENIVDERLVSEATKKHVSELQRKLIVRIVIFGVLTPFLYYFLGLYFGLWCLGIVILSIYVYRMTHKTISASMTVTEYAQRIRKALKTFKKTNRFMWILFVLFIVAWGTIVLISNWPTRLAYALFVFAICCFMTLTMCVSYSVSNVYVSSDVELMLEQVLEDLGKDNQET